MIIRARKKQCSWNIKKFGGNRKVGCIIHTKILLLAVSKVQSRMYVLYLLCMRVCLCVCGAEWNNCYSYIYYFVEQIFFNELKLIYFLFTKPHIFLCNTGTIFLIALFYCVVKSQYSFCCCFKFVFLVTVIFAHLVKYF